MNSKLLDNFNYNPIEVLVKYFFNFFQKLDVFTNYVDNVQRPVRHNHLDFLVLHGHNSKLLNFKILYCRTEAALLTVQKGATEAQDEWVDLHEDELAPGQKKPSKKFFQRMKKKMATYGTVENRVCTM